MTTRPYILCAYQSAEGLIPSFTERLSSYESAKLHADTLLHHDPEIVRVTVTQEYPSFFGLIRRKIYETRIPWN